ncbi:MAG: hypothetical protein Q9218_000704 [Villophora microphyllina]
MTEHKPSRDRRFFDKQMTNLTPLSFKQPKKTTSPSAKEKEPSFEERVKEGPPQSGESPPKYEFKDYRDSPDSFSIKPRRVSNAKRKLSANALKEVDLAEVAEQSHRNPYAPSTVVAVKEKPRRPSRTAFAVGSEMSSSSASLSEDDRPPSVPTGSPVQHPVNSPSRSFYNPLQDPWLSAPNSSELTTFKTLSKVSLRLSKEQEATQDSSLTPKSLVKDTNFRRLEYESDGDADDEKDELPQRNSSPFEGEDKEESDKENVPSKDDDDAGLHKVLNRVSLGAKRRLGEGIEESEEGAAKEGENVRSPTASSEKEPHSSDSQANTKSLTSSQQESIMAPKEKEVPALHAVLADSEEKKAKRVKPLNDDEGVHGHDWFCGDGSKKEEETKK